MESDQQGAHLKHHYDCFMDEAVIALRDAGLTVQPGSYETCPLGIILMSAGIGFFLLEEAASSLSCNMGMVVPGVRWDPGEFELTGIRKDFGIWAGISAEYETALDVGMAPSTARDHIIRYVEVFFPKCARIVHDVTENRWLAQYGPPGRSLI